MGNPVIYLFEINKIFLDAVFWYAFLYMKMLYLIIIIIVVIIIIIIV